MTDVIFAILLTGLRFAVTCICSVKVTRFRDTMNLTERIGLGIMGSGSFLTIGVVWERTGSPFEGWAATLLTFGALLFLAGRTWRDWKHQRANDEQAAYWEARKAGKGGA